MMNPSNDNEPIRFLSVCSGIEAASAAFRPLGWESVAFAEIEKFPSAVLAHHYPDVPNLGDFTLIDTTKLGRVDILCGGTPCQAFSVAGLRRSLADVRGNLTLAFVDLAHALADGNGLRNVIWENVPGVLSTNDNAFGCFVAAIVGADSACVPVEPTPPAGKSSRWWRWSTKDRRHVVRWPRYGMVSGPKGRAAWAVKDAQYYGLAQRRERVLLVADFGAGADPFEVLFEPEGMRRDSPPSREKGQDVAATIAGGARKGGGYSTDDVTLIAATRLAAGHSNNPSDETLIVMSSGQAGAEIAYDGSPTLTCLHEAPIIAFASRGLGDYREGYASLRANGGDVGGGSEALCVTGCVTHTLTAEGFDASEDGSGRGAPIVVHGTQDPCVSNKAFALSRNSGQENVVCFDPTQITCPNNRSNPKAGDPCHPISAQANPPVICFTAKDDGGDAAIDMAPTLRAGGHLGPAIAFQCSQSGVRVSDVHATSDSNNGSRRHNGTVCGSSVRRLMPIECERLQGFPDNYTRIPMARYKEPKITEKRPADMWKQIGGEWWLMAPDGPRYKALGNSWAVPKFRWLGERIARLMPSNDNTQEARNAA